MELYIPPVTTTVIHNRSKASRTGRPRTGGMIGAKEALMSLLQDNFQQQQKRSVRAAPCCQRRWMDGRKGQTGGDTDCVVHVRPWPSHMC